MHKAFYKVFCFVYKMRIYVLKEILFTKIRLINNFKKKKYKMIEKYYKSALICVTFQSKYSYNCTAKELQLQKKDHNDEIFGLFYFIKSCLQRRVLQQPQMENY